MFLVVVIVGGMVAVEIALAIAGNCQQFPTPVFQCHAGKWKWKCLEFPTPVFVQPRVHGVAAKGFWLLANKMRATRFEI